jgi:hypothetical protein
MFALRKPYVKEAEDKEKEKGIKITQQRLNTIIKKVSEKIPKIKEFQDEVDKYGNEAQNYIDKFMPIKQKLTFNKPLTNEMIDYIYKEFKF